MANAEGLDRTTDGIEASQDLYDVMLVDRVTRAMKGSLEKALGVRATLDLEAFLNTRNTSLSNVFQEPDKVSDVLSYLFNQEGSNFLVQTMIRGAMQSCGIKFDRDHRGFASLKDALDAIRIISSELSSLRSLEEWG
jgi:hypothetical protein